MKRRDFINKSSLAALGLTTAACTPKAATPVSENREISPVAPVTNGTMVKQSFRIQELAPKPMLGWNSFDSYGVYLHEKAALDNLEVFATKLKPHGYEYFVIDGGWHGEYNLRPGTIFPAEKHATDLAIDEFGLPEPSQTYWPNGFEPIFKRAKALGVKVGLHFMRGIPRKAVEANLPIKDTKYRAQDIADKTSICSWCHHNYGINVSAPGAQEYYNSLFAKVAEWGVDYVKVDDLIPYPDEIVMIAKAIEVSGRPMIYSLSPGGLTTPLDLPYYRTSNAVRITSDIWDDPKDFSQAFDRWKQFQGTGHPGFWPDLDMIPFGKLQLMQPDFGDAKEDAVKLSGRGNTRDSKLTPAEKQTFITMRALCASPLMIGGDLPTLPDYDLKLITDPDMLACDQNGQTAGIVYEEDGIEVWLANETGRYGAGWFGVFNREDNARAVRLSAEALKLSHLDYVGLENTKFKVRDIWNNRTMTASGGEYTFELVAYGTVFGYYTGT